MGVYIKKMDLPKNRGEYDLRLHVDPDGTATLEGAYCRFEGEPFEAVPVSPHGRCVDADALDYTMLYKENWMRGTGVEALAVWKSDIDVAPTVIPAEEGE